MVKETAVEVVQRLMKFITDTDLMVVIDSSATSFDVPCGDSFVTEETWILVHPLIEIPFMTRNAAAAAAEPSPAVMSSSATSAPGCRLIALVKLTFSKDVWLKDVIKARTLDATRVFMKQYSTGMIDHVNKMRTTTTTRRTRTKETKVAEKERKTSSRQLADVIPRLSKNGLKGKEEEEEEPAQGETRNESNNQQQTEAAAQPLLLLSPSRINLCSREELEELYSLMYYRLRAANDSTSDKKQEEGTTLSYVRWCSLVVLIFLVFAAYFIHSQRMMTASVEQALESFLERLEQKTCLN